MTIKGLHDEDFVNYKRPSMMLITRRCSFKCDKECGSPVCQNSGLVSAPSKDLPDDVIIERYLRNPITHAVVIGGLEPFDQADELFAFVRRFRSASDDDIVIYTGYYEEEIEPQIQALSNYKNIIVKFGRFVPGQEKTYDNILGVFLASPNQHAKRIS